MRNLFLLLLSLFIFLSACKSKKEGNLIKYNNFLNNIQLEHELIETPPVLLSTMGMTMLDSLLVTVDLLTDTIFRVFTLPDFSYLGAYIERGDGPDQEMMVYPYLNKFSKDKFYYQSLTSVRVASIYPSGGKINIDSIINLPGVLINYYPILLIDNELIGCDMNGLPDIEFIKYEPSSKKFFEFGPKYPKTEYSTFPIKRNLLFAKIISAKPDNSLFASVYDKFPIMRIYNKNGDLKKEMYFDNGQSFPYAIITEEPTKKQVFSLMQNYRRIKTTNKFIYALYIGKTNEELGTISAGINDFSNIIHVWNWEGTPVQKIILDRDIFSFCVSPDDQYLICSSINKHDALYKYYLIN